MTYLLAELSIYFDLSRGKIRLAYYSYLYQKLFGIFTGCREIYLKENYVFFALDQIFYVGSIQIKAPLKKNIY